MAGFVNKGKVKIFLKDFLDVVEDYNQLENSPTLTFDRPTLLIHNNHCFLVTKYQHTEYLSHSELLDFIDFHYKLLDEPEIVPTV